MAPGPLKISVLAALFFCVWLPCAAQETAKLKLPGRLFFLSDAAESEPDAHIAAFDLGTKETRRLTPRMDFLKQPAMDLHVDPRGQTAAYLADFDFAPEGGLVTFTVYTRSVHDVKGRGRTLDVQAHHIHAWSPDGKKLIVSLYQESEVLAYSVVEVETGKRTDLRLPKFEPPGEAERASGYFISDWSPNGKWLLASRAYSKKSGERVVQLCLVSADGEIKPLHHLVHARAGRFSPDGKRILYHGHIEQGDKTIDSLLVCDVAGGKPVRVAREDNGEVGHYCWSPDGKHIAYVWNNGEEGHNKEVFVTLVDGAGRNPKILFSKRGRQARELGSLNWK